MSAYVVLGTDSSGREIRATAGFENVWTDVCVALGFVPVITQGGWMGDDGADASGTTHDGDALDLRTRNLTPAQVDDVVRELRAHGIAAWLRNEEHGGFDDPHIHAVPGPWAYPSPAALRQWHACRVGLDGLASSGPDYHPHRLATQPPEDDMTPAESKRLTNIEKDVTRLLDLVEKIAEKDSARDHTSKARHEQIREDHQK